MHLLRSLPFAALAIGLAAPLHAETASSDVAFRGMAQKAFAGAIADYKIPGLVVGVSSNGEHRFYTFGLASRAKRQPVTPDTLFELGSISKTFTATLAALAEAEGKLSLGDKVAHYLCADTCKIGDDLTLMDLATHHSGGLPLQVPDGLKTSDEVVDWLKAWKPSQPGARSYSNVSSGLLGLIAAKAMGMTFTHAAQDVLFPGLGLKHTWIEVPKSAMETYAYGYDHETDEPIRVTPGVFDAEAYGVKSTARDMLDFVDAELGVKPVSPQLKTAIERTQGGQFKTADFVQDMIWEQYPWPVALETMMSGNSDDYALHPQSMERMATPLPPQKEAIVTKTGSTGGFGGYVVFLPAKKLGVVVLANRYYPNQARVKATYALIQALLSEH